MTNLRDWQKKASERSYEKAEAARIQCPCCGETFSNDATIEMSRDCHRDAEIDLLLQIIEKQSEALGFYADYKGEIRDDMELRDNIQPFGDGKINWQYEQGGKRARTVQAEVQGLVEKLVGEK
jgi:hypothetical protein